MQIVLMRHGKPQIDHRLRLSAAEFGVWVEKYNAVGIDTECQPPQGAIAQANQCAFTVCSNLERSLESARLLGVERIGVYSPLFREMDMPNAAWRFPTLSLQAWLVFFLGCSDIQPMQSHSDQPKQEHAVAPSISPTWLQLTALYCSLGMAR